MDRLRTHKCRSHLKGKIIFLILNLIYNCIAICRPDNSCSQPRRSLTSVNSSPSASRKVFPRAGAITPTSTSDLSTIRRSSTSSNDSASSMCSASLVSASHTDSLASSEHSSLSSSNSLGSFQVPPILPDRNNNPKDLRALVANGSNSPTSKPAPAIPHPKPSPKKRVLATPESSTRIPKSRIGSSNSNIALTPLLRTGMNGGCYSASSSRSSSALTSAHKLKSTSSLAIPQLSASTTKIPCLDATNKPRHNLSSRYSSHNIYLAVADESDGKHASKRLFPTNGGTVPAKQRSRASGIGSGNLNNRTKQKSSLELNNVSNENFYSHSSNLDKSFHNEPQQQAVPNKMTPKTPQLQQQQQHRRNHSSSSLPRVSKSAHSSPYLKRRELTTLPGVMGKPSSAGVCGSGVGNSDTRLGKIAPSKLDAGKRFQGSATSLNSTASTASGSTNSSSSSLHTAVQALSAENSSVMQQQPKVASAIAVSNGSSFLEPKKPFMSTDKTPSTLVEVCSWLERNHLASQ